MAPPAVNSADGAIAGVVRVVVRWGNMCSEIMRTVDAIVVGGGPAGLAGALVLARCRLEVLVFDTGEPRNKTSRSMHGYLTREGMSPMEWSRHARAETSRFGATFHQEEVISVKPLDTGFEVRTKRSVYRARKVLMATGVRDRVPGLPGFSACYGRSVFHCPYCDGWEVRDGQLAAFGPLSKAAPLALKLRSWSDRVTLFTEGPVRWNADRKRVLHAANIRVRTEGVAGLVHTAYRLRAVELATGERIPCDALFFGQGHDAACGIMAGLGCTHLRTGIVITDRRQRTRIPGLFVAGDAAINTHLISVACAEGAKAAVAIHQELLQERGWAWP